MPHQLTAKRYLENAALIESRGRLRKTKNDKVNPQIANTKYESP